VNSNGRVLESELGRGTVVVTEDKHIGRVALLQAGDVVRFEPTVGEVQKIVLLRRAGRQRDNPKQ
jgi:hypothetical protein